MSETPRRPCMRAGCTRYGAKNYRALWLCAVHWTEANRKENGATMPKPATMTVRESILHHMGTRPVGVGWRFNDLRDAVGVGPNALNTHLRILLADGLITQSGEPKTTSARWLLARRDGAPIVDAPAPIASPGPDVSIPSPVPVEAIPLPVAAAVTHAPEGCGGLPASSRLDDVTCPACLLGVLRAERRANAAEAEALTEERDAARKLAASWQESERRRCETITELDDQLAGLRADRDRDGAALHRIRAALDLDDGEALSVAEVADRVIYRIAALAEVRDVVDPDHVSAWWPDPSVLVRTRIESVDLNIKGHKEREAAMQRIIDDRVVPASPFYIVWCPTSTNHAPRYRRGSRELARTEAKRLATEHPGQSFYVVGATDLCLVPLVPVEHTDLLVAPDPVQPPTPPVDEPKPPAPGTPTEADDEDIPF